MRCALTDASNEFSIQDDSLDICAKAHKNKKRRKINKERLYEIYINIISSICVVLVSVFMLREVYIFLSLYINYMKFSIHTRNSFILFLSFVCCSFHKA